MVTGFQPLVLPVQEKDQVTGKICSNFDRLEDGTRRIFRIHDVAIHLFLNELFQTYKKETGTDIVAIWYQEKAAYSSMHTFLIVKGFDIELEKIACRYGDWGSIRPVSPSPEVLRSLA